MAIFIVREVFAGFGKGGTAAMETISVVNLFASGLKRENVSPRRLIDERRHTVSLSQLIHLGINMLVRVKAKAIEDLVSECRLDESRIDLPAIKATKPVP